MSLEENLERTVSIDRRFVGKTIVITGAGGQFGRAGCIYFLRRGARVAALDKSSSALQEALDDMKTVLGCELSANVTPFSCDVTNAAEVQSTISKVVEKFGGIHLLWNNAGYQGQIRNTLDYDVQDFATVMNINVTGMFLVLQAVAQQMIKQTGSSGHAIVNTASVAAMRGTPGMIAYSSSKAAVLTMTVCAAKDLAPYNIRVNSISPALIGPGYLWERQNTLHAELGPPFFPDTPEKVADAKIASVPLKRLGTVDEVLHTLAFLLSADSSYTTGQNAVIDGGLAAGIK